MFPKNWHITYSANHRSTSDTMVDYVNTIVVPYVKEKRRTLKLSSDHSALVLFDAFRGQCINEVLQLLEANNILYVMIPPNCTDRIQPLDLSVNKPVKDFLKAKFQQWYGDII